MRQVITVLVLIVSFIDPSFCRNYLKSDNACDIKVAEHCKVTGKRESEVNRF